MHGTNLKGLARGWRLQAFALANQFRRCALLCAAPCKLKQRAYETLGHCLRPGTAARKWCKTFMIYYSFRMRRQRASSQLSVAGQGGCDHPPSKLQSERSQSPTRTRRITIVVL